MKPIDIRREQKRRVVIVDDSKTMQAILDQMFSLRLGWDVVGVATDVASGVSLIRSLRPDLVTIDLCMPYIDGSKLLEAVADITNLRKVVVSANACRNLATVAKLVEAGADTCIDKMEISRDPAAFCTKMQALFAKPKRLLVPAAQDRGDQVAVAVPTRLWPPASYPIPLDESARLAALRSSSLANDDMDHQLDLLTTHLGATTDFPTCLMTFIDRDTQWVKSAYGFSRGSMPRAVAFCNYTLCGDEPFIVPNAAADPRFAANPLVTGGPRIRTYVGCPIESSTGTRLGAICLIDTVPRRVSPSVLTNLRSISKIASELIGMRINKTAQAA